MLILTGRIQHCDKCVGKTDTGKILCILYGMEELNSKKNL